MSSIDIKVTQVLSMLTVDIPAIGYTTGIVKWNLNGLKVMDSKTRKLLMINRGLYPRSYVDHLYISPERKEEED